VSKSAVESSSRSGGEAGVVVYGTGENAGCEPFRANGRRTSGARPRRGGDHHLGFTHGQFRRSNRFDSNAAGLLHLFAVTLAAFAMGRVHLHATKIGQNVLQGGKMGARLLTCA